MKLLDILKKVGSIAVKAFVPGGGIIVDVINDLLPDDSKLSADATGDEVQKAIDSLPAEQRAELLGREFDVQIEAHHTVRAMLAADANSTHTTRPAIALGAFRVVAFAAMLTVSVWAWGVITANELVITAIMNGWPFILAVLGPLVTLLLAYFGVLKQEHKNRLDASTGNSTASGISGILSSLLTNRKG